MNPIKAENLRKLRERRNLTLDQLAEKAGINRTTINRIERGIPVTSRNHTVERLAKGLDVGVGELTGPGFEDDAESVFYANKSQYNFRIANDARNALQLVAERYEIKPNAILHLAPFLFLCAAESSLRQRKLALEKMHEKLRELFSLDVPAHIGDAAFNNWRGDDVLEAERRSIAAHDIFGSLTSEDSPADYDLEGDNPLVRHLIDMGKASGLAEFDSWSPFMPQPHYELLQEAVEALTGGEHKATRSIIDGGAALHTMPKSVRDGGPTAVANWATAEGDRALQERYGDLMIDIGGLIGDDHD